MTIEFHKFHKFVSMLPLFFLFFLSLYGCYWICMMTLVGEMTCITWNS